MLSAVLAAVTKWYELKRPVPAGQLGMRNLCLLSAAAGGNSLLSVVSADRREKRKFAERHYSVGTASGMPRQKDYRVFFDRTDSAGDSAYNCHVLYESDTERIWRIGQHCGNILNCLYGVRGMLFCAGLLEIL